jgi:hypothetical protein
MNRLSLIPGVVFLGMILACDGDGGTGPTEPSALCSRSR